MHERIKKIKNHIEDYRFTYSWVGITSIVTAGITCAIMKGRYEGLGNAGPYESKTIDTLVTMRPFSFLSQQHNIVEVIARGGRGHPGYIVHSIDTGEFFASQREAASIFGIAQNVMSKHLNGKLEHANGYHFERVQII